MAVTGNERPLTSEMEITLFRIAQEALNNIKKYSRAEKVNLNVHYNKTKIKLTISDNGCGFKLPERLSELALQGKLGLIGIEERTRLYGGIFSIQSQPEKGTKITIVLPLLADRIIPDRTASD